MLRVFAHELEKGFVGRARLTGCGHQRLCPVLQLDFLFRVPEGRALGVESLVSLLIGERFGGLGRNLSGRLIGPARIYLVKKRLQLILVDDAG
jgi:hypothetical protein